MLKNKTQQNRFIKKNPFKEVALKGFLQLR